MIKSFTPERIRFRDPALKNRDLLAAFTGQAQTLPGFKQVNTNPATGSVTVFYNSAITSQQQVAQWLKTNFNASLPQIAGPNKARRHKPLSKTPGFYRAMSLTFIACMLSPSLGMLRLHRYSALLLAGMATKHALDYRKKIL